MSKSKKTEAAEPAIPASVAKTAELQRINVAVGKLHPNPLNPNEMSDSQFNLLVDNMETVGFTDPVLARAHPEIPGEYRIIGGQHRWEVAKLLGYEEVPVTVITDPDFTEDAEKFQIVRHNIIGGKMSPDKFASLFKSLDGKYAEGVAAELFGFVEEADFKKLLASTKKALPKDMQKEFATASKELKTIDDLAKLLNTLFAEHGDTLPQGYMIFDFGGYESVWLRLQTSQLKHFRELSKNAGAAGKSVDHFMAGMLQLIANDDPRLTEVMTEVLKGCPDVQVKDGAPYATLDFLD